jgi:hypothetical protein
MILAFVEDKEVNIIVATNKDAKVFQNCRDVLILVGF